jgi:TetR/AcrR family tetracycline transcriptional repressor
VKSSRGRPAKTSREDILDAACAQLAQNPFDELSLSALARSMSLTPMALYRYFDDKDQLLQAIAERLMATIVVDFADCTSWQMKVQRWAVTMWHVFHEHPHLIRYMGWRGHVAGAWIKQVALLANVLREAGLESKNLAMALKWTTFSVIGVIHTAVMRSQRQVELTASDIFLDDALAIGVVAPIVDDLTQISERDVFDYHIAQLIVTLESVLAAVAVRAATASAHQPAENRHG